MASSENSGLRKSFGIYALATCFAIAGFVMSYIANFQCNFIEFNDGSSSLKFGVWAYDTSRYGCKGYPDSTEIDSSWKSARAFGVLAFIFGIFFLIMSLAATLTAPDKAKDIISPGLFLASIFQGLNLLFLNSNACKNNTFVDELDGGASCSLSTGGKSAIAGIFLYFVGGFFSYVARATEKREALQTINPTDSEPLTDPFLVNQASIYRMPEAYPKVGL